MRVWACVHACVRICMLRLCLLDMLFYSARHRVLISMHTFAHVWERETHGRHPIASDGIAENGGKSHTVVHADDEVVGDVAAHRHNTDHFGVRHAAAHGWGGADVVVGWPREHWQGHQLTRDTCCHT